MQAESIDINPYLQQEVFSASPVRLRWMLIKRAEELCGMVVHLWSAEQFDAGKQWLLRIREILIELLEGVQDASNPLSAQISDFYVYLLQLTNEVDQRGSPDRLDILKELLSIEAETWRQLVEKAASEATAGASATRSAPQRPIPPTPALHDSLGGSSFSLEV